jgi:HEAT repeat protein
MDLHFCSRCGISIPQSEIDSGSAGGASGKYFCSEHRGGSAVAVAESPGDGETPDPELLFCANCRVSIPLADVKSGRAHREFGSLLCAGCSKSDPGTRAARREAVEAEMAADVDAQDPVVARRCSVCSAVVPYGQIVTGKAKVEGNRVVCERCRAAADATATETPRRGLPSGVIVFAIMLVAGGLGYYGTQKLLDHRQAPPPKDTGADVKALRDNVDKLNQRLSEFDGRLADAIRRSAQPDERAAADRDSVRADIAKLNQKFEDLNADLRKADIDLAQRVAHLEGLLTGLSDRVRDLAARAPSAPPTAGPADRPPDGGGTAAPPAPEPTKPAAPAVNPQVAKLCKDLLDPNADDGTRFTAATELTTLKDPAAIPSLVKALADDKHYFVRRGCARALGVMRAWLAVPALIKALEDREVYVALAANNALLNVTGNDFGVTQDTPAGQRKTKAQAAEKWWEKNKEKPPEGVSLHPITD